MSVDALAATTYPGGRDDRILPATRLTAGLVVPVLVAATVILYLLPDYTAQLFAWTIKPRMTAMVMGAGYLAGAYFFTRVFTTTRWHGVARGFLPITSFTWFLAITTVLYWDRFNHRHISFIAWVVLYAITPVLIPALWLRNRATDPQVLQADDVAVDPVVRWVLAAVGAGGLMIALLLFVWPARAILLWPWQLTPLTARTLAGWFGLTGAVGLSLAGERRWSAWRILIEAAILWAGLILVAAIPAWNNFVQSNPLTWVGLLGLAGLSVGLVALYVVMETRYKTARRAQSTA